MSSATERLCRLLGGQIEPSQLSLWEWNRVVAQGRSAQVLGMLYARLNQRQQLDDVPEVARRHLLGQYRLAEKQCRDADTETRRLLPAFNALEQPLILLKGAAYVLAKRPCGEGRQFSDIDLLIRAEHIEKLESSLHWAGWVGTHDNAYDQRYYRQWMHEIPPMVHQKRGTVIDIHHTLLPLTAHYKPDANALFEDAQPIAGTNGLWALSDQDQLLHCATHLFTDSELDHAFRDLVDFDGLVREWTNKGDWDALIARARHMDLLFPLFYAIRHSRRLFHSPIPASVEQACRPDKLSNMQLKWMDTLFTMAINPPHPSAEPLGTSIARGLLFLRGHYLRMPFHLLVRHIAHKWLASDEQK